MDKCTLYSDRNLINRRNVKADVSSAANACRRFFQLAVESRIIAGALTVLGMSKIDDENPSQNQYPPNLMSATRREKKEYLTRVATAVVDSFVVDQQRNKSIEQSLRDLDAHSSEKPGPDGRFVCRFPGCKKTFAHNGKLKMDHEASHDPPVVVKDQGSYHKQTKGNDGDDMLAYQKALLDYGMLILNFWDAISEGDGERVIRCWKFALMYVKHQGGSASKYSLEALYLVFQIHALLSPQAAHRLTWNRFIKNKSGVGGHIPLDLQLEFFNKTVKETIKKLGPNASQKSLDRICHSLGAVLEMMRSFDTNLSVFKRSGRHVQKSTTNDLRKLVQELLNHRAFTYTPGRCYRFYSDISPSILNGFDVKKMYDWINDHKKYLILNRRAR